MLNKIDIQIVLDKYETVRGLFLTAFGVVSEQFWPSKANFRQQFQL